MSDWKQGATKRRDVRQAKDTIRLRPERSSKNRRAWCRGKKGVPHQPEARRWDDVKGTRSYPNGRTFKHPKWWILVCTVCGKELEFYMPWSHMIMVQKPDGTLEPMKEKQRPAWVPDTASGEGS